jgi:hypothetical protein
MRCPVIAGGKREAFAQGSGSRECAPATSAIALAQ